MEELQLRKCPGGYKKNDVNAYVESLVEKYEKALAAAREETAAIRRENEALTKDNAELFARVEKLEADRDMVSRAVIAAQQQADVIRADARKEGETLLAEKKNEVLREEDALARLKNDIRSLRLAAAAAIRKYETDLSALAGDEEDEEE